MEDLQIGMFLAAAFYFQQNQKIFAFKFAMQNQVSKHILCIRQANN